MVIFRLISNCDWARGLSLTLCLLFALTVVLYGAVDRLDEYGFRFIPGAIYAEGQIVAVDYKERRSCDLRLPPDLQEPRSFDHVALIVQGGLFDQVEVIESTPTAGVHTTSLPEFVKARSDCEIRTIDILRVEAPEVVITEAVERSLQFLGTNYSPLLSMRGKGKLDGAYYCSELLWIAYQMAWHDFEGTSYRYKNGGFLFLDADDEGQNVWRRSRVSWDQPVTPSDIVYSRYAVLIQSLLPPY